MYPKRTPRHDRTGTTISARARAGAIPALLAMPVLADTARAQGTPEASPVATPEATPVATTLPVEMIVPLTGPGDPSIDDTSEMGGVWGTDLGSTFMYGDEMYMIFGDTFGVNKTDWRTNVAAVITDDDPSDGLVFDRMIEDLPNHAKELLPAKKIDFDEITVIPTYGVAVGDRLLLH